MLKKTLIFTVPLGFCRENKKNASQNNCPVTCLLDNYQVKSWKSLQDHHQNQAWGGWITKLSSNCPRTCLLDNFKQNHENPCRITIKTEHCWAQIANDFLNYFHVKREFPIFQLDLLNKNENVAKTNCAMFKFNGKPAAFFNGFTWGCPADKSLDNHWEAWLSTRLMPDFDCDPAGFFKI